MNVVSHPQQKGAKQSNAVISQLMPALNQHAIVSISDRKGNITYVNSKFTEICGYSSNELLGQNHRILNSGFHEPSFFKNMWETITQGNIWEGEIKNRDKNGDYYWVKSTITPLVNEVGQTLGYASIRTDITELKELESARQSVLSLDNMGNRVFVVWPDTLKLAYMNLSALRDFNVTQEALPDIQLPELNGRASYTHPQFDAVEFANTTKPLLLGTEERIVYESSGHDGRPIEVRIELVRPTGEKPRFVVVFRDITDRKIAEKEVLRFNSILDQSSNEVFMFRASDLRFFYVNQQAIDRLGYTRNELMRMSPLDIKPLVGREDFDKIIAPLLSGEKASTTFETVHRCRDGTDNHVEILLQYYQDDENGSYFIADVRDISERKHAERYIQELKLSLDLGQNELYIFWPDTYEFLYMNKNALTAQGLKEYGYLGKGVPDMMSEDEFRRFQRMASILLSGEREELTWETYSNNRGCPIEIQVKLIKPEGGRPRYYATYTDITSRKTAEDEIRRHKTVLDLMEAAVFIYWPDNLRLCYLNQSASRRTGISAPECSKYSLADVVPSLDQTRYQKHIQPLLNGEVEVLHSEHLDDEGAPVEIIEQCIDLDGNGRRIVAIVRDISERKRHEHRKREFISTVSHELRTPVTSIKGALDLVASGMLGETNDRIEKMLSAAQFNSHRLSSLIDDILNIEKLESGQAEFNFSRISIEATLKQAVENNQEYGRKYAVNYTLDIQPEDVFVRGDNFRLLQVLDNLLSNAAKFSYPGSVVKVGFETVNGKVVVSVRDYGTGIAEEDLDKIFERFSQIDGSDTRARDGTGLGLNIARKIVEKHQGKLEISSRLGEGSTFYFDLPICDQE